VFQITKGKEKSLKELEQEFWNGIISTETYGFDIYSKLKEAKKKSKGRELQFYTLLTPEKIKEIILAKPNRLDSIKNEFSMYNDLFHDGKKKTSFGEEVLTVFNYKKFCDNDGNGFNAYAHLNKLGVTVCPYCNRQYISIVEKKGDLGKTRPELDHFHPKSKYPYLALSFYNLIPSCHVCNSSLKGTKDLNCNPYEKHFDENATFKTVPVKLKDKEDKGYYSAQSFLGVEEAFKIDLDTDDVKTKEDYETLRLDDLYNQHKDIASEIIKKAQLYGDDKKSELVKLYGETLGITEEQIDRFVLGNYTEDEDMAKRPLSKFTRDIAREFGIVK